MTERGEIRPFIGSWPPTLDEDTSGRADGEQWRASYTDGRWGTVYVEAVKMGGVVRIAPLGSDWTGTESLEWVRLDA